MKPAARVTDMQTCPLTSGPVPHVGGQITGPGALTVLISGQPAARVGDTAICTGAVATIATGSKTVMIGGKPAARRGDRTDHGGELTGGTPTVLIGG